MAAPKMRIHRMPQAKSLATDPSFSPQFLRSERDGRDTLIYYHCSKTNWYGVFTVRPPAWARPAGGR